MNESNVENVAIAEPEAPVSDHGKKQETTLQIRTTQEQRDQLKKIAKDMGVSQGVALETLIRNYEMSQGTLILPEKKEEVEQFHRHMNMLQHLYALSIEQLATQRELIKAGFRSDLESKDKMIVELQKQVEDLSASALAAAAAEQRAATAEAHVAVLSQQLEALSRINDSLKANTEDRQIVINLQQECAVLHAQLKAKDEVIDALKQHQ